jgi:methylmalonyl-CoA mutase
MRNMTDQPFSLSAEFEAPTEAVWRDLVSKALKGADFEKKLVSKTDDGDRIEPLYTEQDWPSARNASGMPGQAPLTRGMNAAKPEDEPWDIRVNHSHPDPKAANKAILEDLQGGATSVELTIDPTGENGTCIHTLADLEEAFAGVYLDMAPISLTARRFGLPAAHLAALWRKQEIAPDKVQGAFNLDPIGAALREGILPCTMEEALAQTANAAKHVAAIYPNVSAVGVDTRPIDDAGATGPQGLGSALAIGLAYSQAMDKAGLSIDEAANQIEFTFVSDANFYQDIVKLRAARKLWGRIIQECGGNLSKIGTRFHVETAWRNTTRRDPYVNILRTTVAAFGAALGGADSISVLPFTHALGQPTGFARRVARNSQIILAEESNLGRVIDPTGGAWALEKMTDDYARTSWGYFQEIEGQGGVVAAIRSGWLQDWVASSQTGRQTAIANRKVAITGVSEFPHLDEAAVTCETVDRAAIAAARAAEPSGHLPASASFSDLVEAALKGATTDELMTPLASAGETFKALRPHRWAQEFEALREASDDILAKAGKRPQVFLVNIGPIAEFTARAAFAKNFFEAGGIEAISNDGFCEPPEAVAAFKNSGADIAILCSSDRLYADEAERFAGPLKDGGVKHLYLAGHPGEAKSQYEAAGIDTFIHIGSDLIRILSDAHKILGIAK